MHVNALNLLFHSARFTDVKKSPHTTIFVTLDGAPAVIYSTAKNFVASFSVDGDGHPIFSKLGLNEHGEIQRFHCRTTRLAQALEPGNNVFERARGMLFCDVDFDHITEQPSRCDHEAVQAMPPADNKKKAATQLMWNKHNPVGKSILDQMAIDFRADMRKHVREFLTWGGRSRKVQGHAPS
jgi:hypothetical protein